MPMIRSGSALAICSSGSPSAPSKPSGAGSPARASDSHGLIPPGIQLGDSKSTGVTPSATSTSASDIVSATTRSGRSGSSTGPNWSVTVIG